MNTQCLVTWTNDDPVQKHIKALLGLNVFTMCELGKFESLCTVIKCYVPHVLPILYQGLSENIKDLNKQNTWR